MLAITRRGQQTFHDFRVGAGRFVVQKRGDFLRRRRQAGEVERHAAEQRALVRLLIGLQSLLLQLREDERVNRVSDFGFRISDFRNDRPLRLVERPMPFPRRTRQNPFPQRLDLLGLQRLVRIRGRHLVIEVRGGDAQPEFALREFARHHGRLVLRRLLEKSFLGVEAQTGLAMIRIRPVAGEAVVREDGPHVAIELNLVRRARGQRRRQKRGHASHRHAAESVNAHSCCHQVNAD